MRCRKKLQTRLSLRLFDILKLVPAAPQLQNEGVKKVPFSGAIIYKHHNETHKWQMCFLILKYHKHFRLANWRWLPSCVCFCARIPYLRLGRRDRSSWLPYSHRLYTDCKTVFHKTCDNETSVRHGANATAIKDDMFWDVVVRAFANDRAVVKPLMRAIGRHLHSLICIFISISKTQHKLHNIPHHVRSHVFPLFALY